jgi:hypothetical protein
LREKVAKEFAVGALKPDKQGVIALPGNLVEASYEGRAFVTPRPAAGKPWLLLRYWIGKGANFRGYLYAPGTA